MGKGYVSSRESDSSPQQVGGSSRPKHHKTKHHKTKRINVLLPIELYQRLSHLKITMDCDNWRQLFEKITSEEFKLEAETYLEFIKVDGETPTPATSIVFKLGDEVFRWSGADPDKFHKLHSAAAQKALKAIGGAMTRGRRAQR